MSYTVKIFLFKALIAINLINIILPADLFASSISSPLNHGERVICTRSPRDLSVVDLNIKKLSESLKFTLSPIPLILKTNSDFLSTEKVSGIGQFSN